MDAGKREVGGVGVWPRAYIYCFSDITLFWNAYKGEGKEKSRIWLIWAYELYGWSPINRWHPYKSATEKKVGLRLSSKRNKLARSVLNSDKTNFDKSIVISNYLLKVFQELPVNPRQLMHQCSFEH